MPNKITYTVETKNTTKSVEYWNPYTNAYQDTNPLTNIPAGTYSGLKARLKGSNPSIIATFSGSVTVIDAQDGNTPSPVYTIRKDNLFNDAIGDDSLSSVYAYGSFASIAKVKTTGTILKLNQYSTNDDSSWLAIQDGDNYLEVAHPTVYNTTESRTITLPGTGDRIVQILNGSQSINVNDRVNIDRRGTWLADVQMMDDANATILSPTGTNACTIYVLGDSITVGIGTSSPQKTGWIPKLRKLLPDGYSVISDGYGYRSFLNTFLNQAAYTKTIQRFKYATRNATRKIFYCELSINDYRDGSDLNFIIQTVLPGLFNGVRQEVPDAELYLQTPLLYNEGEINKTDGYTTAQMRTAFANYAATNNAVTLVQGPLLIPGNEQLHPNDSQNEILASNVSTIFVPVDYDKIPEGDNNAVRIALNGIDQKIVVKSNESDLSNGYTAIIQIQIPNSQAPSQYPHLYVGGNYGTQWCFRLFQGAGTGFTVAFNTLSGSGVEIPITPIPSSGGYITIALYASSSGTGFITSLGTSGTGAGISPVGFQDFSIGALKIGDEYGSNFFAKFTPGNTSFHNRVIPISELQAIINNQGLLTPDQYNASTCTLFTSCKISDSNSKTLVNLATPTDAITLE